ncbi:uncharacterized protein B0I36DRAFT_430842 [Microdochium trichocladiopsis]|uniref:Uncharacterized protein n=1 Tax=Microdochium trichocladiopsis TaxID=1682393 RepID=A0A9P8YAN6_9PEZI|nr:uncharacterized protein B0I36DRAFT_430842 [Microdochium trichocladiopsis]KAH7033676.1 hypothetical protein B0I36DRAFT_430842 [Microdochium trichocladiopsis]
MAHVRLPLDHIETIMRDTAQFQSTIDRVSILAIFKTAKDQAGEDMVVPGDADHTIQVVLAAFDTPFVITDHEAMPLRLRKPLVLSRSSTKVQNLATAGCPQRIKSIGFEFRRTTSMCMQCLADWYSSWPFTARDLKMGLYNMDHHCRKYQADFMAGDGLGRFYEEALLETCPS